MCYGYFISPLKNSNSLKINRYELNFSVLLRIQQNKITEVKNVKFRNKLMNKEEVFYKKKLHLNSRFNSR